jgi:hypothetical protein
LLANGVDPGEYKKQMKRAAKVAATNTFEAVGREWFAKFSATWAASHNSKVLLRLENDLFPWLGNRPVAAGMGRLPGAPKRRRGLFVGASPPGNCCSSR